MRWARRTASWKRFTYHDLEQYVYQDIEGSGINGIGERFEILGPFDAPTTTRLINEGLRHCWLVVEVACVPTILTTRHDLNVVGTVADRHGQRAAGGPAGERARTATCRTRSRAGSGAQVERDGGTFYLNTDPQTFNAGDLIYLRCLKRAYDHCRAAGGTFGDQQGLCARDGRGADHARAGPRPQRWSPAGGSSVTCSSRRRTSD